MTTQQDLDSNVNEYTIESIQNFHGKYPKQLWYLFFSEMWERFCFYGMRGFLTVFMVERLLFEEASANLKYGAIQAFIYTMAFIGGLFADKILGFRKSIFWGGLLMITGSLILFIAPEKLFFIGISFSIVGTGFFKPNISTMVGALYKEGDVRRDAGFSLFYSGINMGALLGGVICFRIGDQFGWNYAFLSSAIAMMIGLSIFYFAKKHLGPLGLSPLRERFKSEKIKMKDLMVYAGSLLIIPFILLLVSNTDYTDMLMYIVGPAAFVYVIYEMKEYALAERKKLFAALLFCIFSILFWAFFEQSGGSLSLFARYNIKHELLGVNANPNEINNSANTLFVIIFAWIVGLIWVQLNKRKLEPNTVIKFGIGFLFLAGAFFVFYSTKFFADADGMTSLNVFTLAYFVITFGELCLSPIGLSLMTKLSPKPMWGVMMGIWFLASAYGQYVAGILGAGMASPNKEASLMEKLNLYTSGYQQLGWYALICGAVLIIISPLVKKLMQEVK